MTLNGGGDLTLTRYADQNATEIGFRRVNYPALYQGDLRLKLSDGVTLAHPDPARGGLSAGRGAL